MKIDTVCMLGGTGFVGSHLAARLVATGRRVKIITRRRQRHRDLLVLPGVQLIEGDIHDPATLERHFKGCDAVINLVGILNEKGHNGSGFRRAHVDLARTVVAACHNAGVGRLLHMSALNADSGGGPSLYLRTKGEAENLVRTQSGGVQVTVFRPSVIFGPGDSFLNRFAGLLRISPFLPLACPDARFAPVFVGDVVERFVDSLEDRETFGQRFDLCGPRIYTLMELVRYTARVIGVRRLVIGLPDWASRLQATVFEYVPGKPFSMDNYRSLQRDSVCPGGGTCPTTLESVAPCYLGQSDRNARLQRLRGSAGRVGEWTG
ncbi:epimerase [Thioalkalivibrio denitrificans]|uniref:Epimerase n=1 Tax=Thioalkalivibrio denitrificans TaxID=108003 RepID=A0A1V3NDT3_9GAMM|nr:complex I NDUFA9 subunit family protein [Thioalkalivibrio denitrificans]OOG23038.1 epimerase [Thioalkalivibrio denitrificans]